ncbi:MAG: hypothetical protein JRI59_01460 [Deltaproteobacteria bacterium]|nr:hypothetical protein [Deltaproteobacteria bacterium]
MTALIGGLVAVALGLIGLGLWWQHFLHLLAGGVPLLLLLGGALAVYLGFEEAKDKFFKKPETPAYESPRVSEAEVEKYKAEVERLKSEIEELKKKQQPKKAAKAE